MSDVGDIRGNPDDADQPSRKRKKGGGGDSRPGAKARRDIDNACAQGDIDAAFAAFDAAVASNDPLQPHSCNVLLHLCAGGGKTSEKGNDAYAAETREIKTVVPSAGSVHPERANAVFNHMVLRDIQRTEMTYTALARVEAAVGKPQLAFAVANRCHEEKLAPKLRTFAPALHAFCEMLDVDGANAVIAELRRHRIDLSESEFAVLLKARRLREEWAEGTEVLRSAGEAVRTFGDWFCDEVRSFFSAMPGWVVADDAVVDETSGACVASVSSRDDRAEPARVRLQLRAVHLSRRDRLDLLTGIGKLSRERESADHFEGFVRWLRRRGPLPYLVDGANAGMYNQNFEKSGFNFNQVEKVMGRLRVASKAARAERVAAARATRAKSSGRSERPASLVANLEESSRGIPSMPEAPEKGSETEPPERIVTDAELLETCFESPGAAVPVAFLHVRRVRGGGANSKRARECLDAWKREGEVFVTPAGSNDDWYWLYAAVASGDESFLVSNDEMRDHAFQMLPAPALFRKWKERHQVRFHMGGSAAGSGGLELYFPPPFSTCAQNAVDDTWWMIPKDDGTWLCCVRRERLSPSREPPGDDPA